MHRHLLLALVLIVTLAACFPKAGVPPGPLSPELVAAEQQRVPTVTPESLEQGRMFFIHYCSGCHDYPDINAVPMEKWPKIVDRMVDRTKQYSSAKPLLTEFIQAVHQ